MTEPGESVTHVMPASAREEWAALSDALHGAGGGCQLSAMPEAWWLKSLEEQALAVCAACPSRGPCLDYALAADERLGVWGGMTESQRLDLRRRAS